MKCPPVVLWSGSCGDDLWKARKKGVKKGFSQSSWFWEVIDMAYSQMGTIPWGEGGMGC